MKEAITPDEIITPGKYKTDEFAKNIIETKGNATQAYLQTYPNVQVNSAGELGSRKLKKVETQQAIAKYLSKDSKTASVIKEAIEKAKRPKNIKWSELHGYIETDLKLKGYLKNTDDKGNTNIAIVIEK